MALQVTPILRDVASQCPAMSLTDMVHVLLIRTLWSRDGDHDVSMFHVKGTAHEVLDYIIKEYDVPDESDDDQLMFVSEQASPSDIFAQLVEQLNGDDGFEVVFL